MFFSGLFAAYFTLRGINDPWPAEGVELSMVGTVLATIVLLSSSVTMHMAVGASARGDRTTARRWLAVTSVMGALFLAHLLYEWSEVPFSYDSNSYGSIFFLMTGFHGLHVLGGLVFMGAVAFAIAGRSPVPTHQTVDVCSYYWHFVDVVWVAMFLTIYVLR
jgi:cytochrome c oxidase subunit 3